MFFVEIKVFDVGVESVNLVVIYDRIFTADQQVFVQSEIRSQPQFVFFPFCNRIGAFGQFEELAVIMFKPDTLPESAVKTF